MKNVYRATRPTWSQMDKSEMWVILVASILVAFLGVAGELVVHDYLQVRFGLQSAGLLVAHGAWAIAEIVLVTAGCVALIQYYKRLSIGCYPTTFLYCFSMPEASNPDGKSQVVGYCHLKPNRELGDIEVVGASFFWENEQLNGDSRLGFTSSQVWSTKEKGETTCHIRFGINPDDFGKRNYHHGILQFRLDKNTNLSFDEGPDKYAGYLQSTHRDSEIQEVEVRSKGYAEYLSEGQLNESEIRSVLRNRGGELIAGLQCMLRTVPMPTLWEGTSEIVPMQCNTFWKLEIPTPQSVVQNKGLKPYIDALLSSVLSLTGADENAIERFKALAKDKAIEDRDDTRVAYERDLKAGLIGRTNQTRLREAVYRRAVKIKTEIEPFLEGDSLLDIGCGNGMVATLLRGRFREIQLLDVVQYLPPELGLPFKLYKEGESLPVDKSYDTVLLLTVLHHAVDPVELLKLAWGVTRKKLIIIESVVGIHNLPAGATYALVNFPDKDQIAYAAFVDWFYNRVLHDDVPVPYNFTTPEKWISVFTEHHMKLGQVVHLGQDIDIAPEYHVLFVLQRE
jgi:SAM-dependent methyltransferase